MMVWRKAVQLDDSLAETHAARANSLALAWKWPEAETEFKRALQISPNNATAHYFYSFVFLLPQKRYDEAFHEIQTALSLDPLSPIMNTNLAAIYMDAHRYPEALAQFQKTLDQDPHFRPAHFKLSVLYAVTGRFADANAEMAKSSDKMKAANFSADPKGYCDLGTLVAKEAADWKGDAAAFCALQPDRDKVLQYLNDAISEESSEVVMSIRFPTYDAIRSDPRFAAAMQRLNLPQ